MRGKASASRSARGKATALVLRVPQHDTHFIIASFEVLWYFSSGNYGKVHIIPSSKVLLAAKAKELLPIFAKKDKSCRIYSPL
jgi:hypothetical protein